MPTCPECDATIDLDPEDVDLDDRLSCDDCGASLKVTSIAPLELDLDDDEDDEDEFDDDEKEEEEDVEDDEETTVDEEEE